MTTLLYLMACLMSPAPLINSAESRVPYGQEYLGAPQKSAVILPQEDQGAWGSKERSGLY